jgi:3-oxoacyl-[acyl-carrier protein] reductase
MKTAFITGSTRGIGRQIGIVLLNKGYHVIFNYAHNDNDAKELKKYLMTYKLSGTFQIFKADMSIIKNYSLPKLDVLILNAGITDRTPFGAISVPSWDKVFDVNLTVPFFLIQSMRNKISRNGKILFISSIAGCTTDSTSISYGVSKGALHVLVPYLAKAFAQKKITVNAIAPGYIDTMWHTKKSKSQLKRIAQKCLAKRLGTTAEIAKLALHIIENDFINGQVIRCDGGFQL